MQLRAALAELSGYVRAVGEEARRLQHRPQRTPYWPGTTRHPELAHVGADALHVGLLQQVLDLHKSPTRRQPRMFVQKVTSMFPLVVVELDAEAQLPLRLLDALAELGHPQLVATVHVFVQLLQAAEERTRR